MRSPTWTSPSPASTLHYEYELRARKASTNTCLPQSLLSVIPDCAVACLQNFASHDYPGATCANTSDLNFLCTQPNTSGLTIGEGSVQCVVAFCTGQDQLEINAYNICNGIAGAQPRTVGTITATIIGHSTSTSTSSTMNNLPATISNPTSTEDISMIVMATDSSTWITATTSTSTAAPSSTSMSADPDATSGAITTSDKATSSGGLTKPQVAGMAIGGVATVVIVFGLVMLYFWMRRRRRERRRSQRRSRLVEQTPPNYQSPQKKTSPAFDNVSSSLTEPNTNGRFYGSQQPMEEKRRSFWRKSIRPEEIGIAVSPKIPAENSPVSTSSEQSFSRLLPTVPAAALWPAPLDVEATRDRKRYTERPVSDTTEFDDEPDTRAQRPEQIFVDNQSFILEKPPLAKRPRGPPPNLKLPVVPESPPKNPSQARIPLTPTYDNGNIQLSSPLRSLRSPIASQGPLPVAEHKLPSSSMYANRNVLPKNAPARLPLRAVGSPPVESLTQPRNPPLPTQASSASQATATARSDVSAMQRASSVSSVYTEIEEDTTPEETYKQLELRANPTTPSIVSTNIRAVPSGQESPIKDLRYPQIPRSAAVSRQAERPAQLRASLSLASPSIQGPFATSAVRPTRNDLVRSEVSFVQTDTTSSDGYLSDSTIEFPIPPSSKTRKPSAFQLRNNPSSGNKRPAPERTGPSLNEVLASDAKTVNVAMPQRSPSTKARLTPSKSSTGDLYLTVEI